MLSSYDKAQIKLIMDKRIAAYVIIIGLSIFGWTGRNKLVKYITGEEQMLQAHSTSSAGQSLELKEGVEYKSRMIKCFFDKVGVQKDKPCIKIMFKLLEENELVSEIIWVEEYNGGYRVSKSSVDTYNRIQAAYGLPAIKEDSDYDLLYADSKDYTIQPTDKYYPEIMIGIRKEVNTKTNKEFIRLKTIKKIALPGDSAAFAAGLPN